MKHPIRTFLALGLATLPCWALAHVGADGAAHHGFGAGFAHPFTGVDHLLAMLVVGVWSGVALRRQWVAPAAFAAMMLAGALAAMSGLTLAPVELVIALSLLALGTALAGRAAAPPLVAALVCGVFAFFHGAAHGQELTGGAALAGMVIATLLLHLGGLALGLALRGRSVWWSRAAGLGTGAVGLALMAGSL